jgi:hypothetical protein
LPENVSHGRRLLSGAHGEAIIARSMSRVNRTWIRFLRGSLPGKAGMLAFWYHPSRGVSDIVGAGAYSSGSEMPAAL